MRRTTQRDEGATLLELLSVMVLAGILMAIVVGPWRNYQATQDHKSAARLVVAALRNAQVSAVAEETSYSVQLAGKTLTVRRVDPVTKADKVVRTTTIEASSVSIAKPDFAGTDTVVFTARGTATAGEAYVVRSDRSKVYTVTVEGLTARVSFS